MDQVFMQTLMLGFLSASGLWGLLTVVVQVRAKRRDRHEEHEERTQELAAQASVERMDKTDEHLSKIDGTNEGQTKLLLELTRHHMEHECTQIRRAYDAGERQGITMNELHSITGVYEAYANLGGNGSFKMMYESIKSLPLI